MHADVFWIFHTVARWVIGVLLWLALFPVAAVISTLPILLLAACDDGSYWTCVKERYRGLYRFWVNILDITTW